VFIKHINKEKRYMFMRGDLVRYCGSKFAGDLKKNGVRSGEILTRIPNEEGVYVVEFGDEAYTMSEGSLTLYVPSKQDLDPSVKEAEVVQKKRRRQSEDES
jgi:hypothetical protein